MSQPSSTQADSTQFVSNSITVPLGHVVAAEAWRNTQLISAMTDTVHVIFCENMGVVDFMPSEDTAVIFISEADLLSGSAYRRRVVLFRNHNKAGLRGIVIVNSSVLSQQQFATFQTWCSADLGLTTLSVSTLSEAGRLIAQFSCCRLKAKSNPFLKKTEANSGEEILLSAVGQVPGLGPIRAERALNAFGSLVGLASASPAQLGAELGNAAAAQSLYQFLHDDNRFTSS